MPTSLQGLHNPVLGYNLNGVADYSTQLAFLDLMKISRPLTAEGEAGRLSHEDLQAGGYLDANGYPTSIPDGYDGIGTIWDWTHAYDEGASESRAGTYVVTWDGEGSLEIGGVVNIVSEEPGRIVFESPTGNMFNLTIRETDPDGTGDYIRDISIVREEHVELHEAGAIFNPDWIELIEDTRQLRFMDWMDTNNSPVSQFSELNTMDSISWVGDGQVPVEVMVQLANEIGADPWFTLPAHADENLIREFASYVEANLDPNLVATFELSNEAWNWMFQQTHDFGAMSEAEWGLGEYGFQDPQSMYAKKAVEMALILNDVFEGQEGRLHKTLGVQTGDAYLANKVMTAPLWEANDPDGYIAPYSVFDSLAVTTYFGGATMFNEDQRAEFAEIFADPDIDTAAWLTGQLRNPEYEGSIPRVLESLAELNALAESRGLDIVTYEGGQHVHQLFGLSNDVREYSEFFADYIRSDDMAELYQELWDGWQAVGDGPQMQFTEVGAPGDYGSWSLRASHTDTNPRVELIERLNQETEAWWEDRGGAHFQQGVTHLGDSTDEVLEGTQAEDYLIGAGGNDVLTGHGGDDGLHGGAGDDDIAIWLGNREDYSFVFEVDGQTVVLYVTDSASGGADGHDEGRDRVVGVETLQFADQNVDVRALAAEMGVVWPEPPEETDDPVDPGVPGDPGDPDDPVDPVTPVDEDQRIDGTEADEFLAGGSGDDHIDGRGGIDFIEGGAGNDIILGHGDGDVLYGQAGDDWLFGGDGNDVIQGGEGRDLVHGGAGNDILFGNSDTNPNGEADDTAVYDGSFEDYNFSILTIPSEVAGGTVQRLRITDSADGGADGIDEGSDILFGIDQLHFGDSAFNVDDVMAALNAGADPEPFYATWQEQAEPEVEKKPVSETLDAPAPESVADLAPDQSFEPVWIPDQDMLV